MARDEARKRRFRQAAPPKVVAVDDEGRVRVRFDDGAEHTLGDASEVGLNGHAPNGKAAEEPPKVTFPAPKLASELKLSGAAPWIWHGYIAPGGMTLMSALWKAGKTTLLAHLLRAMELGGDFCGLAVQPSKVLYVTEESENRWAMRRDKLRLADHLSFLVRPFRGRPDWSAWADFTLYLQSLVKANPVQLVVIDPIANLWPVRDENDNAQVGSALLPLQSLCTEGVGLLLVHHTKKGDGEEATASRGAGAFPAFVDTIIELRRYRRGDAKDSRRVLKAYGRDDETPDELVVELGEDGFAAHGDRGQVEVAELMPALLGLLSDRPPGMDRDTILDAWPEDAPRPGHERLTKALGDAISSGRVQRLGTGRKGAPFSYYRAPHQ